MCLGVIQRHNQIFNNFEFPFKNNNISKFVLVSRFLLGLIILDPIENKRSTAADDGIEVLYLINA